MDTIHSRPTVALLISDQLRRRILSPMAFQQLTTVADVVCSGSGKPTEQELPQLLEGVVACITGWDTPDFSETLLDHCPDLRLIAHAAGSIRRLLPTNILSRDISVTHANAALAEGVAEFVVLQALYCLRNIAVYDQQLKNGLQWSQVPGRLLRTQTFGVVGTGSIGRGVIERLRPFGCRIIAYDPYLTAEAAQSLGIEATDLDTLFSTANIVSLHVPLLPTTRGMIGARQLALLRPGAIFLNTARAGLVDETALLRELETGRFTAALDVFHHEPLPMESKLRTLNNVVITPHIAALTGETLQLQGQMMVDEIIRFLTDQPLHYRIAPEMLPTMA